MKFLFQMNEYLTSSLNNSPEVARHADHILFSRVPGSTGVLFGDGALLANDLEGFRPLRLHFVDEGDAELLLVVGKVRDLAPEDGVAVLVALFQLQKHQLPKMNALRFCIHENCLFGRVSHCSDGVLLGAVASPTLSLYLFAEEHLGEDGELRLLLPVPAQIVDDARVDDVGVEHPHCRQVRVQRLAHEDRVRRQQLLQVLLHVD